MNKATLFDYVRLCKHYEKDCRKCPLQLSNNGMYLDCDDLIIDSTDKANEIILKWCKEHPVETRQDRFLKLFPNAKMGNHGVVVCCPTLIYRDFKCDIENVDCPECRKNYWLTEVEENEWEKKAD